MKKFLVLLLSGMQCCFADSIDISSEMPELWLTGPLLTPTAAVASVGVVNLEPYLFSIVKEGIYNNNGNVIKTPKFFNVSPQILFKTGICKKIDFITVYGCSYNRFRNQSAFSFSDLPFAIEYQLFRDKKSFLGKLSIQETFPLGKYQKSRPAKLATDLGGMGSFVTQIAYTFSKVYHVVGLQYFRPRVNLQVNIPSPVYVKGINAYGGGPSTHGKVFPGISSAFYFGAEYTLTKKWALAIDVTGTWTGRTRFKGSTIVRNAPPYSTQYTIAPALEYNWSQNMGIIVGSWFTLAGKSTVRFYSAVGAFNYFF